VFPNVSLISHVDALDVDDEDPEVEGAQRLDEQVATISAWVDGGEYFVA
jgi:hypothetical protein